jgi:UDP-N-acetylmuramoylalanine--D-glutamate ligase
MHTLQRARRAAIWGFGREGRAVLEFIRSNCPDMHPAILNDTPLAEQAGAPLRVICGDAAAEAVRSGEFDLIVKSPGISLYRPEITEAKRRGVRFTSATNLWFELHPEGKTIAVTGTKGKSTTARLLHHLLAQAGLDVRLMGNVGIAALGQPAARDFTVLELSSYQIADLEYAPDIAVVTNLFPEHAPWHGGAEQYFRDKLRILALGERTRAVANHADERLRARLARSAGVHWFNAPSGYGVADGRLLYDGAPVDCSGFPLKGEHNLGNLAAACTAAELAGVPCRSAVDLRAFQQLPHRMEEFRVGLGLLCVDDSIATVPEATAAALEAYPERETVLLLGGADRGQDYAQLIDLLPRTRVTAVIVLPPSGERILADLSQRSPPFGIVPAANLDAAVREGMARVAVDGLLLLSPAAASFGEFQNFEERGNAFKALCRSHAALIGSQRNAASAEPRHQGGAPGGALVGTHER